MFSPVIFSLFINELVLDTINNGKHSVSFSVCFFGLFLNCLSCYLQMILFCSLKLIGLQIQLNS